MSTVSYPVLTDRQAANLQSFAGRIVPDEPSSPGAVAVGADYRIREWLVREMADEREAVVALLDGLGDDFAALPPDIQDERLTGMEQHTRYRPAFLRLAERVQEAFYITPAAWRMIGWEVTG